MINDILKALGQLADRRFVGVLVMGIALSLALLAGFTWGFVTILKALIGAETLASLPWVGTAANVLGIPVMLALSVFLMVPVASAFTGLFLERIMNAVEAVHYPNAPTPRSVPLGETLRDTFAFLGLLIGANLLAVVLYVIFLPFAPLIFWGLNGFLLGREYAQMVAMRHLPRPLANGYRKRYTGQVTAMGLAMAVPLSVPVLNLMIPLIGAASFTHQFHRLTRGRY